MTDCPRCGTHLRPLFTSLFCPNDCDRRDRDEYIITMIDGFRWRMALVPFGARFPQWATRGRYLLESDRRFDPRIESDAMRALAFLRKEWEEDGPDWWKIENHIKGRTNDDKDGDPIAAFGRDDGQ